MIGSLPAVRVSARAAARLAGGHLWVYGDDLRDVPADLPAGQWVRVFSRDGGLLGTAMMNLASRITLRLVGRGEAEPTRAFLARRIAEARERRALAGLGGEEAVRLVFSEGDFLPGLIVDRFGTVLSLQILSAGMEAVRDMIISVLAETLSPRLIYERSEGMGRRLEGLPDRKGPVCGDGPVREEVVMDGLRFLVDVSSGPKTGFFLDQRGNRRTVRALARGRTVLDGFCAAGGFGHYALAGGATRVLAVDSSPAAVASARDNADRNGFGDRWEGVTADLFEALRAEAASGRRFDLVVLDPPAFAKTREGIPGALRGYRDINRLGMTLLEPDGVLATSSCTQLVDMAKWRETLRIAAADARVDMELLATGGQFADHPVLMGVPETEYLKFVMLRKRSSSC
jgi:23S rRNA (cytosine1962-C5)-methyltransferase